MKISLATAWIVIALGVSVAADAQNTSLRAGAAKVDVTPSPSELPKTYDGILDHLYSRAIVLESGNARAALITVDAGAAPDAVWKGVSEQVEKDLGIPARNVLLTATHTHSVPGQTGPDYVRKIVEAVRMSKERLGPGRGGDRAAGDQNPIYFQQTFDLRDIRIKDYAKRGIDISNAMPPGGQGLNKKDLEVMKLMDQQKQMIVSMGQFLGEEVLPVMRGMERADSDVEIYGAVKTVSCPGRTRTNEGRAGFEGTYKDADPVEIKLGLLRIGDITIGAVNAEVFNPIAQRLKKESPYARTMMATLTNGMARSGYIPNDAAYGMDTFEVLSSRLKPGCAERAIVNGILDLMA